MRPPAFWERPRASLAARLLSPAAAVYGAVAAARLARPGARVSIPVICVGNFTLGGTGKTPVALRIAELLREAGETPWFASRGYGGTLAGPVRVDPGSHGAAQVGDEPLLLARSAPTIVGADRVAAARQAALGGASVLVMDDGLQNPSLLKDLALAVVDGEAGFGNGRVFPAGPLRAPLSAQWPCVDAVVVVGSGAAGEDVARDAGARRKPVLQAALEPEREAAARLRGARVLAFCGIGRPEKFFATLRACGATVAVARAFPDHHRFTPAEVRALRRDADAGGLLPVTTEKDFVRLATDVALAPVASGIAILSVRLEFRDEASARALIGAALARARQH